MSEWVVSFVWLDSVLSAVLPDALFLSNIMHRLMVRVIKSIWLSNTWTLQSLINFKCNYWKWLDHFNDHFFPLHCLAITFYTPLHCPKDRATSLLASYWHWFQFFPPLFSYIFSVFFFMFLLLLKSRWVNKRKIFQLIFIKLWSDCIMLFPYVQSWLIKVVKDYQQDSCILLPIFGCNM